MGRWRIAAGALVPLLPAIVFLVMDVGESTSVVLLVAAVVGACLLGGATAGAAAVVLSGFVYDLIILPPRYSLLISRGDVPHLVGFVIVAGGTVAVVGRLQAAYREAERARDLAQQRADELAERVELIGPVLDAAPIGFALLDTELRYRYVNERLAEINGLSLPDYPGRRPADLFPPEVAHLIEPPARDVLATGRPHAPVRMTIPLTGAERYWYRGWYPVRDAAGDVVGVVATVLDVTEQVELSTDRVRTMAELTATIESSPLAIALVDTDLRYRRVNQAYARVTGTPVEALVGSPVVADGYGVDLPGLCTRTLAGDRPIGDVEVTVDDRHLTLSCFPVRLDGGEVVGVALMLLDVTERRRLAQLEVETERLRATAELTLKLTEAQQLAGFVSWDYDVEAGRVRWSGPVREIFGVDFTEGTLADLGITVHPDDVDRTAEARHGLLAEDRPFHLEHRLIRPDGSVLDVFSTGKVLRDEQGDRMRFWGTLQDVTGIRAAERAARDANRRVEQTRTQLEAEHQALQMFQRAMLPAELPTVPGVQVAAEYLPVAERIDIGGDWYDAFLLPDGRLALAVGDVTGHDLRAATVMGQVRNAVRAYASEDPTPGDVLRRTNTLLSRLPDLDLVTMLYGVYDPGTHELLWSNAGHPPPLLRRGTGASALTDPGGLLLGVLPGDEPYPEYRLTLAAGDAILWYTDGLIDHRDTDPTVALQRLTDVFGASAGTDADRLVSTVSRQMLADGVQEDDICLLTLHRPGPVGGEAGGRRTERVRRRAPSPRRTSPSKAVPG